MPSLTLPGYEIDAELHSGDRSLIFRGRKAGVPVIIKVLRKDHPDQHDVTSLKHEFEILQNFRGEGTLRAIAIEKYRNSPAVIFEDTGGAALTKIFNQKVTHSLADKLDVMIKTTQALAEIHEANLVHKDIKPQNIVLNEGTGRLQIIDFHNATLLAKQTSVVPLNSSLEGTLAYISPEQTGRVNRSVDYRTDLYSLGVTFYQLLTGAVPFMSSDPLELIHAHIAKTPLSPRQKANVPKPVSEIVMKLLSKNPEERYQSAGGLLYDLEACRRELLDRGENSLNELDFRTGVHDQSERFQIPEKLYGREREIAGIVDAFRGAMTGRTELLLISGRSGIGKSVLINELNKPITESRGYFASGKYDSYKRSIPYRAITRSFQGLVQQVLAESPASVSQWRDNMMKALGANGKLVIDVIPELQVLIGDQPPVVPLPEDEAQNRFNTVFQNFISVFCTEDHPTAIFLDDLQWADDSSIHLIRTVLSNPDIKHFLLMLSFRDNEVLPTDPFAVMIADLKKSGLAPREILLSPLSVSDVEHIVADTLTCPPERARELAQILCEKTQGNPFFVNELFRGLYFKDLIHYANRQWSWDIQKIRDVKISDNVIDFLIEKVKELPVKSREILKLAACVGNWFRQDVFLKIAASTDIDGKDELIYLANEGFLRLGQVDVNFVHDKIREAAYTLISKDERASHHYGIGNTYLSMLDEYKLEDHIFTIVNQLNQGSVHVRSAEEKARLLELNLLAGGKALASAAYEGARGFFGLAINSLPPDSWDSSYQMTLDAFTNRGRAEYLSRNYAEAEKTFDLILSRARSAQDKIVACELKSSMYVSQNRMIEALGLLKQTLKSLGASLPRKPGPASPLPEIIKFKLRLRGRPIESLRDLPVMDDPTSLTIMRLLNAGIAPAFIGEPALFPVIVLKMVNLSLRRGISPLSPFAFAAFGIIQGSGLGDFSAGDEFGKLAVQLISKFGDEAKATECRTNFMYTNMVAHWKRHAREGVPFFLKAIEAGRNTGDLQYTSYSLNNFHFQKLLMRQNLDDVLKSFLNYDSVFVGLKQYNAYQLFQLNKQVIENFKGWAADPLRLKGGFFDEDQALPEWLASQNANALFDFYTSKARLEYFFGDVAKASEYSLLAKPLEGAMFGMMFVPERVFFDSLIAAALSEGSDRNAKKNSVKRLRENTKRLQKWAESCPANYGHKYHIANGLLAELSGNRPGAMTEFRSAIALAKEHDYVLEEAVANELTARLWRASGDEVYERLHLAEALYAYQKWGFEPKVREIIEKYPQARRPSEKLFERSLPSEVHASSGGTGASFDVRTVLKASQAISGEIQLGKLLERMMKILFENAGAERGSFMLKKRENWHIEAEGNANKDTIEVLQAKPVGESAELGINIVNYVIRTKDIVLLNNASNEGMFINDPYVKTRKPKSVLCYPILHSGALLAVVYLENNLTTNAFTPDRIEVLKVLSSQIAVSVDNSLLYAHLEENVQERTRDLSNALAEVRTLKEQQDMDYYLNTLLVKPLSPNNASSENATITCLVKQKKRFLFRKREWDLGGDINISENMELQGRPYLVFLNGDAMGKSIQGAGGVLVLGTIFKSIIQRTISTDYGKTTYPERWLKNAHIEIHKAFESFDGSMLMSAVFGLVDDTTGTLYFLNAMHPDMVLFRAGRAVFLEPMKKLRKLGHLGPSRNICVDVLALRPGDVVICGSDGREDVALNDAPADGGVTDDETFFLRHTENGKGDLQAIYESITSVASLTDDLSLLRIGWKETTPGDSVAAAAGQRIKQLTEMIASRDFRAVVEIGSKLVSDLPHLSEFIYELSFAHAQLGEFDLAINLGERMRLREPNNPRNLANLIRSYSGAGRPERAREVLDMSLRMLPDSEALKQLERTLR